MIRNHNKLKKTALVIGIATFLGLLSTAIFSNVLRDPEGPIPEFIQIVIHIELFITTFNLVLLLALTWAYMSLYRDLPNKYSMSLVILSLMLLLYALTSNPFIHFLFGFPPSGELGPFSFISDVFVGLAIIVLFYQSQT